MAQFTEDNGRTNHNGHVKAESNGARRVPFGVSQVGVHDLVPKLGYREYWYPAIAAKKVGRRSFRALNFFGKRAPVQVKILGEDIAFFPGKDGTIAALWDRCPHRGAYLSRGFCLFDGTVSCPYHGYTFDAAGTCVAALTEGPDSGLNGKLRVRHYPTAIVRGVVFVWMGETEPVPIEEDVPEDLFDPEYVTVPYSSIWPMNWTLTIENSGDSHNSYLHRFRLRRLLNFSAFQQLPAYWSGIRIVEETDNSIGFVPAVDAPQQAYYPGVEAKWPRQVWWRWRRQRKPGVETMAKQPYRNQYRLPSIARVNTSITHLHTRYATPVDEKHTLMWTFGVIRVQTWWQRLWAKFYLRFWYYIFTIRGVNELEDLPVQRYDRLDPTAPQKLGANDQAIIYWRRRMPLKSRDNVRLWKKGLHIVEEMEAQELAAQQEAGD